MRYFALAAVISVAASAFSQAVKTPPYQGASNDESYTVSYSRKNEVAIVGRVTGKIKGTPSDKRTEGMSILVRDSKNVVHEIDMGPTWFIKDQEAKINLGDKVKVIGSPIHFRGAKDTVVLARQIIRKNKVLTLRDESGFPYWNATRPSRTAMNGNPVEGEIVSENPVQAENEQEVGYQIRTPDGLVNVAVAPDWYMERQGIGFKVGDNITVYTGAGPSHFGNSIILANGLYGTGGTFVLRNSGVPIWTGWNTYFGPGY
ncbi:MAG TPA: hypothetical protein VG944_17985 [Fimbriimonas sp.]|nr:hypothetical protein [Fimbriimonas sp.]